MVCLYFDLTSYLLILYVGWSDIALFAILENKLLYLAADHVQYIILKVQFQKIIKYGVPSIVFTLNQITEASKILNCKHLPFYYKERSSKENSKIPQRSKESKTKLRRLQKRSLKKVAILG